jgi:hypothetical protein
MAGALKTSTPLRARQRQIVAINDLTGGVDLRRSPTLVSPNRARTLKNISLSQPGAAVVRAGYVQASSASLGVGRAQGGARVYLASTVFSLLAWSGAVKKPTDGWVFGADVLTGLSTANQIYFPYDRDLVAVMDGASRPKASTNGSNWFLMGTDAPSSAATLSSASSGALSSGEYAVAYSYKHRGTGHESNVGPESTLTISASTGAIAATASPSTDTKVDAYVWYARHKTPDLESVLRKVSSGAASTFTFTSSNWTSADEAPTNHHVPATGLRFAVYWKNRWWAQSGTVGNRLHFTELFLPQAWPSNFYLDLPFQRGDSIAAVAVQGDTLVVYGQSGKYLVVGQTSLDFEVRPAQSDAGAFGPRCVSVIEQALTGASADGVDSFDGAGDRALEFDIQPAWRDLVSNSQASDLALVATVYDPLQTEYRVSVPRVYPTGARGEWVLDLNRTREQEGAPAWVTTDRDIAFYMSWNGNEPVTGNRGRIFTMPTGAGLVFEERVGTSANSSNLTAEYEGPTLSLGLHKARAVDLHVEYEPHAGAFSVEPVVDGVSQGTIGLTIGAGLATYDTATYDLATYAGSGRRKTYTPLPLGSEGRNVLLKWTYTGQEAFAVFGYAVGVLPDVEPRRFSE